MVYNIWNYLVSLLCPWSGILKTTRGHKKVSDTGSVSELRSGVRHPVGSDIKS
jgi:hypothetical protein